MRAIVLLALAGCWTGAPPQPPPPSQSFNAVPAAAEHKAMRLRVTLERTPCLGRCPTYRVTILGDGRVEWEGIENVAAIGKVAGRVVPRADLERLARLVDDAKFFDRNQFGELDAGPLCTTNGATTTCSYSAHFCSDTTHAKLTISRNGRTHVVDNDHCDENPGLDELEDAVDQLAGTAELAAP